MPKITQYTTFYPEKITLRKEELFKALKFNLNNEAVSEVVVLEEGESLKGFIHPKLVKKVIEKRPTYDDFIQLIREKAKDSDISIIANTDIYFNDQIALAHKFLLKNDCWALSRWDIDNGRPHLYNRNDSQDVWVFKGKPKETLQANFPLGVVRCDNKFMYLLKEAGYKVLNPAFSIKAYHLHKGQRQVVYNEADNKYNIQEPFAYLYPHNLKGFMGTFLHNFFADTKLGKYRYDNKKLNSWLFIRLIRKVYEIVTRKEFIKIGYDE